MEASVYLYIAYNCNELLLLSVSEYVKYSACFNCGELRYSTRDYIYCARHVCCILVTMVTNNWAVK